MTDQRFNWFVSKPYLMPEPCTLLGYGPLAHVMERQNIYISMCYGGAIALFDDVSTPCYPTPPYSPLYTGNGQVIRTCIDSPADLLHRCA